MSEPKTCIDEGCPQFGTDHVHVDPENWTESPPQDPRDEALRVAREALWICREHAHLYHGNGYSIVAECDKALRQIKEMMGEMSDEEFDSNAGVVRAFFRKELDAIAHEKDCYVKRCLDQERENAELRHDIERHVKICAEQANEIAELRKALRELRVCPCLSHSVALLVNQMEGVCLANGGRLRRYRYEVRHMRTRPKLHDFVRHKDERMVRRHLTWGDVYYRELRKGTDHGWAAYKADQWYKRKYGKYP